MGELALDAEDAAAVLRGDRDALLARGRTRISSSWRTCDSGMEREPVSFEFF